MGPDLFRLVSVLGRGSNQVRGRVQFSSLLLKADKNKHLDFGGSSWLSHKERNSFNIQFCLAFILS